MRFRLPTLATASLVLAACGGGGPPSPAGLGFSLPDPATVTYVSGDTVNVDIDVGGQSMQQRVAVSATYGATFTRAGGGIQVSLEVQDLSARVTSPMGGPVTMDGSGIDGPLVFTLDRRGVASVLSSPTLTEEMKPIFASLSTANSFFPRLPGTAVDVGGSWTDTIQFEGPDGPGEVSALSVLTYTVAGDTVVDGRSLLKITYAGTQESNSSGVMQGANFSQEMSGTIEGHVLWDMGAGLMVERFADSTGRGSIEVAVAPFPLGLRARAQSIVRLTNGM